MTKKNIASFLCLAIFCLAGVFARGNYFAVAAFSNGSACSSSADCSSNNCNNATCCNANQCGWGDASYFTNQCVDIGGTRENSWARVVCRDVGGIGTWKVMDGGWGCNIFGCDSGSSAITSDGKCYCRSCAVDPGTIAKTNCSSSQCYWGPGSLIYTGQCYDDGETMENPWGRTVCANGVVKIPLYGWGCASGTGAYSCESGACQNIGGVGYCLNAPSLLMPPSASYTLGAATLGFTCKSTAAPSISSIVIANGGDEDYIDAGDTIKITFSEAVKPSSINSSLSAGDYVTGVAYSSTGGVSVSSSGIVTVNGIATFDAGSVGASGTFTSKLALDSTSKILTITLTGGNDIRITAESLSSAYQTGGVILDTDSNAMAGASISVPTGSFGNGSGATPYISSIVIANGGDEDYIDAGDTIKITFSEAVKPSSINSSLSAGDYVTGVAYSSTGGVSVSSSGIVTVNGIATFDAGSVGASGTFTSKLALSSNGKILTITLTSGDNVKITSENFSNASQIGGTVEDVAGNEMADDSSIDVPTGSFGGGEDLSALYAQISQLQAEIAALQRQLAAKNVVAVNKCSVSCARLTKYLYYGIGNDAETTCLQEFLKAQGYAVTVNGSYDLATKTAVAQFQLKYGNEILAPYGLTYGSGNVGNDTRNKINQVMASCAN